MARHATLRDTRGVALAHAVPGPGKGYPVNGSTVALTDKETAMSESHGDASPQGALQDRATLSHGTAVTSTEEALRKRHTARARSASGRTRAACRAAGVEADPAAVIAVPTEAAAKAANALRLSADALAALAKGAPDPAADARQARNAAAASVLAARIAQSHGAGALADAAYHAALKASQAAGMAAGREGMGRSEVLNAEAEAAEAAAVAAAEAAGWR
ncbi:hypothetical protein TPA0598_02_02090 [Streptomyces lydicamycinicus]|uniref:Uncharacterized protein n=1 Tax=Streptomyces lydicamycinicus TaxID=1546107 RepID=A0A0N7YKU3_9ACTN|nr:hypothetical protein TPA0598_02_02090 [Streptomyces lydicamycinicus]